MYVSTCRHTLTDERVYGLGLTCSLCLGPLLPLQVSKVCSCCGCRLHLTCYREILGKLHTMTAALEEGDDMLEQVVIGSPDEVANHPTRGRAATAAATATAAASSGSDSFAPSRSFNVGDFSQYLERQRDKLWVRCMRSFPNLTMPESASLFSSPASTADSAGSFPTQQPERQEDAAAAGGRPKGGSTESAAKGGDGVDFASFFKQFFTSGTFSSSSSTPSSPPAAASGSPSSNSAEGAGDAFSRFLIDSGKSAVKRYLSAAQEEGKGDANVDRIVSSLLSLVDHLLLRHPRLSHGMLRPLELRQISKKQEVFFAVACDALPDAALLDSERGAATADATAPPTALRSSPTLRLMRDVLRYAIAVYGEEYRQGTLSNMFSAAMLFTFNRKYSTKASKAEDDKAVTEILSLPPSALRLTRWSRRPTEPSYALLVDTLCQRIVVSFRGTLTDVDILTDICAFGVPFCGGRAHQGVAHCVNYLFDCRASIPAEYRKSSSERPPPASAGTGTTGTDTDAAKLPRPPVLEYPDMAPDALLDTLGALAAALPTHEIVITGHSLGAGTAALFGFRLFHDKTFPEAILARVKVITFAPLPTLSYPAATEMDKRPFWSVVSGYDAVPRLQLNSIDRACALLCEGGGATSESGAEAQAAAAGPGEEMESLSPTPPEATGAPSESEDINVAVGPDSPCGAALSESAVEEAELVKAYVVPVEAEAAAGEAEEREGGLPTVELHHPGRVYLLTTPWEPKTNRLVEVPRGHVLLHDLFLVKPMIEHHMMDAYADAMKTVHTREEIDSLLPAL